MVKRTSKEAKKRDDVPDTFESIAEAGEFWDEHDSGEYEDIMTEVDFDVEIKQQILILLHQSPLQEPTLTFSSPHANQSFSAQNMVRVISSLFPLSSFSFFPNFSRFCKNNHLLLVFRICDTSPFADPAHTGQSQIKRTILLEKRGI